MSKNPPNYISTTNACKLCTPLGASLAFKGIEGAVPYLHGSQGCATYMRRYIISHFNEPIDIASSSLSEKHAVYGGGANLKLGLQNVTKKYHPKLIGIATTCLTETIGDDVGLFLKEYEKEFPGEKPQMVQVSTPSYSGTHMEGFHNAVAASIKTLTAPATEQSTKINILPGFISPADIRYLKEILSDFGHELVILPDISDTMDGGAARTYHKIQPGGTPIADIQTMSANMATIEFGHTMAKDSGGVLLSDTFQVPNHRQSLPMGITAMDQFMEHLAQITGRDMPLKHQQERGRLIDSYVDGHKYLSGKKAIIYGEEDLVVGLSGFLAEIGVIPVLCASGGKSGMLARKINEATGDILNAPPIVHEGMDFFEISGLAEDLKPDLLVGHSKGAGLAREMDIPIIRVGFPVHDRMGGQRILHLGYRGAQNLFDRIVNAVIAKKQADSPVGYSYM
jgi:nitrogenase molybdenum-iron protein NifN